MTATEAGTNGKTRKRKPRGDTPPPSGRVDPDGQEQAQRPDVVADATEELERAYIKAQDAGRDLNEAIKKVAQKSGYLASNVRAYIAARVGDKVDDKRRNAEQQLELFDKAGE